jgi:hypothetical protein
VPNLFSPIDRVDFDFDLPPLPSVLGRADRWFDRLNEVQRIAIVFLTLLLLAAAGLYCLGLGSTVLVNRAEAALAVEEARVAAEQASLDVPTLVPIVEPSPTTQPTALPAVAPTRPVARPTQVVNLPTPIPAQLLPTVPLNPQLPQRAAAPAEQPARPRLVAPVEPATPTPPARTAPSGSRAPASGTPPPANTAVRAVTPNTRPSGSVFTTPVPAGNSRPAATSAPAAKPTVGAPKPGAAPILNNPIGPTPITKPSLTR